MAGYENSGAIILLDDYNLFPSEGVFMQSDIDFLKTKFDVEFDVDNVATYTLANSRGSLNVLVKFSQ